MTAGLPAGSGGPAPGHAPEREGEPDWVDPRDVHDRTLVANVRPPGWVAPAGRDRYHLVVIGAGTAGLVAAIGAAGLGARVALIERALMGGDCLNTGCVPSKALLRAARAWADVRDAGAFGVEVPPGTRVDFPAVMARMRGLRAALSPHDSARRCRELGVDVFFGTGRFTGPAAVRVGEHELRFGKALIATGARPAVPPIPGLAAAGPLTSETVFALTALPRRLAVVGAGPIGCELSQAFARFGAEVSVLETASRILPREDGDAAGRLARALARDGVRIIPDCTVLEVGRDGGERHVRLTAGGRPATLVVDEILVATGRVPRVEDLGLEAAGIAADARTGVRVDDHLRTTNPRVFAAGDVCSARRFTHHADFQARIAVRNALFLGRARASALVVPWCIYTDPEVGHVGLSPEEAGARGIRTETLVQELAGVDRAVLDGESEGLVKVHVRAGTDRIVGATVVARHAGEMLPELALAVTHGVRLGRIGRTIHPYPTQAEAIRRLGDLHARGLLTPRVRWLLAAWLRWTA